MVSVPRESHDLILVKDNSVSLFQRMRVSLLCMQHAAYYLVRSNCLEKEPDANSSEITGQFGSASVYIRNQPNRTSRLGGSRYRFILRHKSQANRAWDMGLNKVMRKGIIEPVNQP